MKFPSSQRFFNAVAFPFGQRHYPVSLCLLLLRRWVFFGVCCPDNSGQNFASASLLFSPTSLLLLLSRRSVANSIKFLAPTGSQRQKINFADVFLYVFCFVFGFVLPSSSVFFLFYFLAEQPTNSSVSGNNDNNKNNSGNSNSRKRAASYSIKSSTQYPVTNFWWCWGPFL